MSCYQYNPHTGKYSANVMRIMQAGGILTLLVIAGVYARTSWKIPGVRVLVVCVSIYVGILLPVIMYTAMPVNKIPPWAQRSVFVPIALLVYLAGRWAWKSAKRGEAREPLASVEA